MVVVINADKIRVSGKKMQDKYYQAYSGYPSGQKTLSLSELIQKQPTKAIELAITRMMTRTQMRSYNVSRLRIYTGETHPHASQKPIAVEV